MPSGVGVTDRLSVLGAALRTRGVRVGSGEVLAAHRALATVDAADRDEAYLALRAVLCSRHEDLPHFAEAFEAVFGAGQLAELRPLQPPVDLGDAARLVL